MINRLTVAVGWEPGRWLNVAREGGWAPKLDPRRELADVPIEDLLAEIARRTGAPEPPRDLGSQSGDDPA